MQVEGNFSLAAAQAVVTPISEQLAMGKNLDMIWENRRLLPSLADELRYMNEGTAIIKLMHAFSPMMTLAVGKNAMSNNAALTDFIKTMILDDDKLKNWRYADFRSMIMMAIRGEFGTIYDRIDAAVVYDWINKYATIRLQKIEDERIREQKKLESEQMDKKVAEKLSDALKKVIPETVTKAKTKHYSSPQHFIDDPDNALIVKEWSKDYSEMMGISLNDYLYTNAINLIKQTG